MILTCKKKSTICTAQSLILVTCLKLTSRKLRHRQSRVLYHLNSANQKWPPTSTLWMQRWTQCSRLPSVWLSSEEAASEMLTLQSYASGMDYSVGHCRHAGTQWRRVLYRKLVDCKPWVHQCCTAKHNSSPVRIQTRPRWTTRRPSAWGLCHSARKVLSHSLADCRYLCQTRPLMRIDLSR